MKTILLILAITLTFLASSVHATIYAEDINEFVVTEHKEIFIAGMAFQAFDTLHLEAEVCAPQEGLTISQIYDSVAKFMKDNPDDLELIDMPLIIGVALIEAYPCE